MLTRADKSWVRKMVREEIGSLLEDIVVSQIGGYDGATDVSEDDDGSEQGRKPSRPAIGFHTRIERRITEARRTRKL